MTEDKYNSVKILIIGGGAISQQWHLPILLGRADAKVVGVVDKSSQVIKHINSAYPNLPTFSDFEKVPDELFCSAIVATPARFHYSITKELLQLDKHVLVEKPISFSFEEANELVDIADSRKLVLCVSLYRRLYQSLETLKHLVKNKTWGQTIDFEFLWGDFYSWSAATLGNMKKELAGGGVLMDLGPHALDWLCYLFGDNVLLKNYTDDSFTGIETDCELSLEFKLDNCIIPGKVLLSRIRKLGGVLRIKCEKATLKISVGERFKVSVTPSDSSSNNIYYDCQEKSTQSEEWFETFAKEHDDFISAIIEEKKPKLSGKSVLISTKIIDQCYRKKQPNYFPWSKFDHIRWPNMDNINRVFVTGASGFLGSRLVEIFAQYYDVKITAGVNNPNNATRLSRFDIDLVRCDINDIASIENAISGCDAVIHCAIGTAYGDDDLVYKTTVNGTRNLLEVSTRCKVSKFIHMSSLAVIDMKSKSLITESSCKESTSKDIYSKSKLAAEKLVKQFIEKHDLNAYILRPTNIFGPYAPLFKVGAGYQAINHGIRLDIKNCTSPINSVFVDNVVLAIILILRSPKQTRDRIYFINDECNKTYQDFYSDLCNSFNTEFAVTKDGEKNKNDTELTMSPLLQELRSILLSTETKQLALRIFNSPKIGFPTRWALKKLPKIERRLRDSKGVIYYQKSKNQQSLMLVEPSANANVSMELFKSQFSDYLPVDYDLAMKLTKEWIKLSQISTCIS